MSRITSAASTATSGTDCWGQSFSPDSLANLNTVTVTQCTSSGLNISVDGNNHINSSGFSYDAVGNMTQDATPGVVYAFDAENRLYKAAGVTGGPYCYLYDGNGLRVAKKSGAASDCTGGTVVKLYWRSLAGDALAESDGTGSTSNSAYNDYVFFAGRRVGSRNGTGGIFYWFVDHLGTTRSITTGNGPGQTSGQLCYDADFTPYGQEMSHSERLQTTACQPSYRFTGYEYDSETGLDYAFARYYSPRLGRFYSTDPLGGSIGNLQSDNAYAYVTNNPLNVIDPLGLCGGSGTYPDLPCPIGTSTTVYGTPLPPVGTSGASGPNIHCTFGVSNGTFTACNDPNGGRVGGGQATGGGAAAAPPQNGGQQSGSNPESYADCVKNDTKFFSLQHGLQAVSDGRLGNGLVASALLGSEVSDAISLAQGDPGDYVKGKIVEKTIPAATKGTASLIPDISVTTTSSVGIVVQSGTTMYSTTVTATQTTSLPLGRAASLGAEAVNAGLEFFGQWKLAYDLSVASFSAVVCGIGR